MKAQVIKKEQVAEDIYNFTFKLDEPIEFKPGQYVTVTFTDKMKRRPFSVLDYNKETNEMILCVQKNGEVTQRMFTDKLPYNMDVSKARGKFTLPEDNKSLIMIAGGVGIVPLYNMAINNDYLKRSISLFYSCKTPEKMAMREELQNIPELITYERFTQMQNRFTFEEIMQEVPNYKDSHIMICGSFDFVQTFKKLAAANDISEEQIKTEIF